MVHHRDTETQRTAKKTGLGEVVGAASSLGFEGTEGTENTEKSG